MIMFQSEEEFGEERLNEFVEKHLCMDPDDFHREFFKKMADFSQEVPLRDDLTLLSLRFQ